MPSWVKTAQQVDPDEILLVWNNPPREILINGQLVAIHSPNKAILRIGMVHQHFMLVPSLTVAENIVLGMAPTTKSRLLVDYKKAVEIAEENAARYNLRIDPNAKVMDIPFGMKQKVEILKALVRGAKIVILDEPTAV
jgi:simple sugar transport system ATP-binding protein